MHRFDVSKKEHWIGILIGILLIPISIYIFLIPIVSLGLFLCFLSLVSLVASISSLLRGQWVEIDDDGIVYSSYSKDKILWKDVKNIFKNKIYNITFICIELIDPYKYPEDVMKNAKGADKFPLKDVNIGLGKFLKYEDKIIQLIKDHKDISSA